MNPHPSLREQLDACRAGSDDLQLPELADLATRVSSDAQVAQDLAALHQADHELRSQLVEVKVPEGLAARLLSQLAAARQQQLQSPQLLDSLSTSLQSEISLPTEPTAVSPTAVEPAAQPEAIERRKFSRRTLLQGIAGGTLAAALAGGAIAFLRYQSSGPTTVSRDELAAQSSTWIEAVLPLPGWKPAGTSMPLAKYPIDRAVTVAPRAWRSFQPGGTTGGSGVAYDLTRPGSQRALLFVIRTSASHKVPSVPDPHSLLPASGNMKLTSWQSAGILYVLAVDDDHQNLSDYLRTRQVI